MVTLDEAGRARPWLDLLAPDQALAQFIEHGWIDDYTRAPDAAQREWRIVPDDAAHILWHRYAGATTDRLRLILVGPRSRFADVDKRGRAATVGVRLKAGAVTALFGIPAAELTDRTIALDSVIGAAASQLAEEVASVPLVEALQPLHRLVAARARRGGMIDARVAGFDRLTSDTHLRIGDAARALGVSTRSLRLIARRELGLGAREFVRIRRLHRALQAGLATRHQWARAAAAAGYVDQAHLTRECVTLLGETPAVFAKRNPLG